MIRKEIKSKNRGVDRDAICSFLDSTLNLKAVNDYSCNGLQVEGRELVQRVGCAVDACMETYRLAAKKSCDMLIVHHGIVWGGIKNITGRIRRHVHYLLEKGINLYAAHLPLDLHPTLGNNAQLAKMLGIKGTKPFGVYKGVTIGIEGRFKDNKTRDWLVQKLCGLLDTTCTVLPFGKERIQRVAIVSGGGAEELQEAIEKGVDCYITGEPSHENYHAAKEADINVIYAGHYHTEKMGVQALGRVLEKRFGVESVFLDIPTPL